MESRIVDPNSAGPTSATEPASATEPDSTAEPTSNETVRVTFVDRRKPSLRSIYHGMFQPRRRRVRREEDAENAFLDWHPPRLLWAASAVLLLSLLDGIFTVRLIGAGVQEINPLMDVLLKGDAAGFALAKWFLTALGVIALVAAAHAKVFGRFRGEAILLAMLAGYLLLVLYGFGLTMSLRL
jgi:hypothetical protein